MARKSSRSSTSSSNSLRCLVGVMLAVVGLWILGAFVLFPVDEHLYPHRHSSMSSRFSATTQTVDKPALDDGAVSPFQGQSGDQQSNKGSGPRAWTKHDLTQEEITGKNWLELASYLKQKNDPLLKQYQFTPKSVTLVSALVDLGRGKLGSMFNRPFTEYINRFRTFLQYDFPKVLFLDEEHFDEVKPLLEKAPGPIKVYFKSQEDLRKVWFYEAVQKIRNDPKWANRAGWLAHSPQAKMELYNPLVMSKLLWTRDVARWNPFNTDSFLFIDGGHLCNNPNSFSPGKHWDYFRTRYFDKLFITFFDYTPDNEVHGFEAKAYQKFIGTKNLPVKVGRGGVFGGTRGYLEAAAAVYEVILEQTLKEGYMGTEENILAIMDYRFPDLVHHYDNDEGGNCAIFNELVAPPIDWGKMFEEKGYDLRGLECAGDWKKRKEEGRSSCRMKKGPECPVWVTPETLTIADRQAVCQNRYDDGWFCTVECSGLDADVKWYGHHCEPGTKCPPYDLERGAGLLKAVADKKKEEEEAIKKEEEATKKLKVPDSQRMGYNSGSLAPNGYSDKKYTNMVAAGYETAVPKDVQEATKAYFDGATQDQKDFINQYGWDLRGLNCERKDGSIVCFYGDDAGREECPPTITPLTLAKPKGQYLCQKSTPGYFCTVACQSGNSRVEWRAHQLEYCDKHEGHCPKPPPVIPKDKFVLPPWTAPQSEELSCDRRARENNFKVDPNEKLPVTLGILVYKTMSSLSDTLETYKKIGLLQHVSETLLYINSRNPTFDKELEPYTRPPYNIKLMGDSKNYGILNALNWLAGNATNKHLLFLEKDFQLVESYACAREQILTGIHLVKTGTAHVIKYRSRYNPGRPNWADILFRGKEERVFRQQPNLLCNFYHWIPNPDQIWPDKFYVCNEDPKFYCTKAEFCNWTNNPVLFDVSWWKREYTNKRFKQWKHHDPFKDVEFYMNWEPNAWNNQPWMIASGDGIFKHVDRRNFAGIG